MGGPPRRYFLAECQDSRRDREVDLLARMCVLYAMANEGRRASFNERAGFALEFHNKVGKPEDDFWAWASTMRKGFSQHDDMDKIEAKKGVVGTNMDLWEVETLDATTSSEGKWSQALVNYMVDALLGWNG